VQQTSPGQGLDSHADLQLAGSPLEHLPRRRWVSLHLSRVGALEEADEEVGDPFRRTGLLHCVVLCPASAYGLPRADRDAGKEQDRQRGREGDASPVAAEKATQPVEDAGGTRRDRLESKVPANVVAEL